MSCKRCCLACDPFHQIAVAAQHINVVVEERRFRGVETRSQIFAGDRHSNRIADALAQWSSCSLDACCVAVLGVAGARAVKLTKPLQIFQRETWLVEYFAVFIDRFHTRQVDQRIEQHGCVTAREHEAVSIWPLWVGWIVAKKFGPDLICDWRQGHRRARMAAIGCLDPVNAQRPNGIDRELFDAGSLRVHDRR